jgi:hypothetical protein
MRQHGAADVVDQFIDILPAHQFALGAVTDQRGNAPCNKTLA